MCHTNGRYIPSLLFQSFNTFIVSVPLELVSETLDGDFYTDIILRRVLRLYQ